MKVAHITASVSRSAAGIFEIGRGLGRGLVEAGVDLSVLGLEDEFSRKDTVNWAPLMPQACGVIGPHFFGYSRELRRAVFAQDPDLCHLHTMWMYPSVVVHSWSRATGRPYVVSPNGMLEPWALRNSAWKKRIAARLYERKMLDGAFCLQANTEKELNDFRSFGLTNPVAVIPNGVDLPEAKRCLPKGRLAKPRLSGSVDRCFGQDAKTLLFLGRLHPKKGLPEALRAWAEVTQRGAETGWRFVIAGWDQGGHEAELKRICGELGVRYSEGVEQVTEGRGQQENSVVFAGPAFGETKDALLRSADAFILPSLSEGLPMSVLEAWAYGLPVVMTEECNLPEGFAARAAIKIGLAARSDKLGGGSVPVSRSTNVCQGAVCLGAISGSQSLGSVALRELMAMTDEEREAMGVRGRKLVEERFTWPKVAAQMKEVYDWALGSGARPDFIRVAGN